MTPSRSTPIISVAVLTRAAAWFTRRLEFFTQAAGDSMTHFGRDDVHISLIVKANDINTNNPRRQQSIYIDVADVDAFYAAHQEALEESGEHCAPFNLPHCMREVHAICESLLMYFGSPTPKGSQ